LTVLLSLEDDEDEKKEIVFGGREGRRRLHNLKMMMTKERLTFLLGWHEPFYHTLEGQTFLRQR